MGRKGATKRKSSQPKDKPSSGAGSSGVAAALQTNEGQPARGGSKPTAERKQTSKKG